MALRLAAWVVDQEIKALEWAGVDFTGSPDRVAYLALVSSPALATVSITPYYQLGKLAAGTKWAVRDTLWTQAVRKTGAFGGKYNTYTLFNYYPRIGAFAQRGGWRFAATKVGSRFIPYVGWGLFALDLWAVGKWIGEKTSPV